jgi:4-amino-4-deoxy-L-arabinose transferase-like glycosyltransferase
MSPVVAAPASAPERKTVCSADVVPRRSASIQPWHAVVLLCALSAFLFFYGLAVGELYRTESLRAIIGAEFLRSGNWIVPTLYGQPLFTKPPGMYAAIALVSWPFGGVSDWSARLPSALAATATVFLFYWCFGRQFGRQAGLIAAAILPASLMWLDKASAAEIDMLQAAWVSAAFVFFVRGLEAIETSSWAWAWWPAALVCVAGGFLTKWTAPAFFYGTAIPLLWWRGRLRLLWGRHHLVSAALGAALCLAWITAAVSLTGWHEFYDTVSREAMQRLVPSHNHRPYPWVELLAHPLKLLAASLPWSVVAVFTFRPGFARRWDERGQRTLQALHCWLWPNLVFWTVIPEHAARHSFPIYPAVAGLAAMVWISWVNEQRNKELNGSLAFSVLRRFASRPGALLLGYLALWLVVKLVYVHAVIPARNQNREPRAKGELLAALVPEGDTLFLSRLKDEGIMFYYGRPVRRLESLTELPSSSEPVYCILDQSEWRTWKSERPTMLVQEMKDEQGAPIFLVRVVSGDR